MKSGTHDSGLAILSSIIILCALTIGLMPFRAMSQQLRADSFKRKIHLGLGLGPLLATDTRMRDIYGTMIKVHVPIGYVVSKSLRLEVAIAWGYELMIPICASPGDTCGLSSRLGRLTEWQGTAQYLFHGKGFIVYLGGGIVWLKAWEQVSVTMPHRGTDCTKEGSNRLGELRAWGPAAVIGVDVPISQRTILYLQLSGTSARLETADGKADLGGGTFEVGVRRSF